MMKAELARPAVAPRPARRLPLRRLLPLARGNWLAACDEELFEEMIVERRSLWLRYFVISDPDGIRRVLQDNYDNYPRYYPIRQLFEFGSGTGMLYAEGDLWRRHRRLLNPTLDHRALAPDLPLLGGLAGQLADYLADLAPEQEIDIAQVLLVWIVASAGHLFSADDRAIDLMVDRMGNFPKHPSLLHFFPLPSWLAFMKPLRSTVAEAEFFRPLLDRLLAQRRSADYAGPKDLLWRMAHAADRNGDRLSAAELRDELLTLGATSRSSLRPLTWMWYLLALHPWAETRVHEELDRVLGGRSPTAEDLPKLVYLRKVLDETMRLYPPLPLMIPRVAEADDVICGRPVPRHSIVSIIPWVLHRHRRLWSDPDRFDPERFSPEQTAARSRYAYLPFSIGPHVCIGASLALIQIMVAAAVLAQRFRFRLVPGQQIEPAAWIHLSPNRAIKMTVERR